MRAKRADGGVASRLLLFASTPQSNLRFASSPAGAPFGQYLNSYVKPPSPREVDFAKQKTEGVISSSHLLLVSLPQKIRSQRISSSLLEGAFGCSTSSNPKAVPVYGGFEPSAPGGRCSEGRIGRNREYCKRQRCKTTIFQPALWVSRKRKPEGLRRKKLLWVSSTPQSNLRFASSP